MRKNWKEIQEGQAPPLFIPHLASGPLKASRSVSFLCKGLLSPVDLHSNPAPECSGTGS